MLCDRSLNCCFDKAAKFIGIIQGDYLSGKPGHVREFDSCQGNVRAFTKSQGSVGEKSCQGKVA